MPYPKEYPFWSGTWTPPVRPHVDHIEPRGLDEPATWPIDDATAHAVSAVIGMSREQLVARLTFLAPELSEEGLRSVVVAAMVAPKRPLDREALDLAQRAREAGAA